MEKTKMENKKSIEKKEILKWMIYFVLGVVTLIGFILVVLNRGV
jgi:uncharacterized membrane protein YvbJ|tara:strand:+ start:271 stop:402 length:132 start_codon:yes stop_codon:yes gene_type:complete